MDRLRTLSSQLRDVFLGLPVAQRISFATLLFGVLIGMGVFTVWVQQPSWALLYGGLDQEEAGEVIEALAEQKVLYRVGADGHSIEVPAGQAHELRMTLAARGLPKGGGVGFELFDQQTLGMTDFVQRLGYQRALQGELARTIAELEAVASARVHLALPERSLFVGEDRRATASVVLHLRGARGLDAGQIAGVVHLVAGSVEGLEPEDVTVVDAGGNVLSRDISGAARQEPGERLRDGARQIEAALTERVESLLERVLGPGHAVARVNVELDRERLEQTEEEWDPDKTAVRSERRTAEKNAQSRAQGVPGVQAALTNAPQNASSDGGPSSEREESQLDYEVTRITRHRVTEGGGVRHLSVAVLVDGAPAGKDSGKFVARSAEEIERYRRLIESAVGYDEGRGDKIEVSSVPFHVPVLAAAEEPGLADAVAVWSEPLWRGGGLLVILIVAWTVVRPFLLAMASRTSAAPRRRALVSIEEEIPQIEIPKARSATAGLTELARQNPEQTAMVIKQWVGGTGA